MRVTFRLGFAPQAVSLDVGDASFALAPTRAPTWRATRSGDLVLFASIAHGDASYVACAKLLL